MKSIKIEDLITYIPDGKKREYLSSTYIKGITNYHFSFINEDLNLNDLVSDEFKTILHDNNNLIKHLRLFCESTLNQIIQITSEKTIVNHTDNEIRKLLINYFNLEIEIDSFQKKELEIKSSCSEKLHDFQERIRRTVINMLFRGEKKFLIHMPTGSGKTRTAAEIIIDFIRFHSSSTLLNERLKIIWVAQSSELCEQAFRTIQELYNQKGTTDISYGHFYGDYNVNPEIIDSSAIIFTSIQKLLLHYKSDLWFKIKNDNYLVVVDEAHRSVASEWVKALDFFVDNSSVNLIGLTATPGSGSNTESAVNYGLSKYYDNNKITLVDNNYTVIDKPIEYLVEREFLAEIDRNDIESGAVVLEGIASTNNDKIKFKKSTLIQLTINANRNSSIINIIKKHFENNEKILVFTCGIDHNKILRDILKSFGIPSQIVDTNTRNRDSIIHSFKNGNLNVLLNYGVLTTGFDAPKTNVCLIARPVESIVMYSQMVGRILRGPRNGHGNKKNTLYTIKDNLNHGDYDKLFNSFNNYWN